MRWMLAGLYAALALPFAAALAEPVGPAPLAAPAGCHVVLDADAYPPPVPYNCPYTYNGHQLKAFLYLPSGTGPFPVYLWNHGSEQNPHQDRGLAAFWLAHGFVFYKPIREGHGGNPGAYIGDEQERIHNTPGLEPAERFREIFRLHENANEDVVAAHRWIAHQPFVDPARIVVAGGSSGAFKRS